MTDVITGSVTKIRAVVSEIAPSGIAVFAGGSSYERSGAAAAVSEATAGVTTVLIRDIPANPDLAAVNAAIARYRSANPDLVLAIGGGSVLDLAKVVNAVAPFAPDAEPYVLGNELAADASPPLVAVPTTSGSGSEATRYAVVTVDGVKRPMQCGSLLPTHVILDPELTYSLPRHVTASTGLDALAHAMEAMWSVRSEDASTEVAARALELAWRNIESAVNSPDARSRAAMMEASHLAGVAIDTAPTSAPHALSFRLTTVHGVPHGHAVALTLGATLEYNSGVTAEDVADPRGASFVRTRIGDIVAILGASDPADGREALHDLIEAVGLEPTLSGVGAGSTAARRSLAEAVSPLRLANNPRSFPGDSLRNLIDSIP